MKFRFLFVGTLFLLTACGGPAEMAYVLTFEKPLALEDRRQLAEESLRVMERRLEAMLVPVVDKEANVSESGATVRIRAQSKEAIDRLTADLTEPFDLRIMAEAPEAEADVMVEGQGGFKATGITQEDIAWVQSHEDASGKGEVRIVFTESGTAKMYQLIQDTRGKKIGIFVRKALVSVSSIQSDEFDGDIFIRGIPDAAMATIFAEDANVGANVTFTPLP